MVCQPETIGELIAAPLRQGKEEDTSNLLLLEMLIYLTKTKNEDCEKEAGTPSHLQLFNRSQLFTLSCSL